MREESESESFEDFMTRALMDPKTGYYTKRVPGIGARGDFATSASVGDRLARAIAAWLISESRRIPHVRTVIEIGGGEGTLMAGVRKHVGWWRRHRLRWVMVERSVPLINRQKQRLGGQVTWVANMDDALRISDGHAWIYHNEFLDALPFRPVEWSQSLSQWQEVRLTQSQAGPHREELSPLPMEDLQLVDYSLTREWSRSHPPPAQRQRGELHTGIHRWLQSWAPFWKRGAMLTLDYGDLFPDLYRRRPHGTARAYLLHHRLEGMQVYENPGRQDITCDINFTDVRQWSSDLGWTEAAYGSQSEFLSRHAPGQRTAADAYVGAPEGAGAAFKYLCVRRP